MTSSGQDGLQSGDTWQYLEIAERFAKGDFSMSYVKSDPQRQPLYPSVIAPIVFFKGTNLYWLAAVNIILAALGFVSLYLGILKFHGSRWIPAVVGVLYLTNRFLFDEVTSRLLTEPLHILLITGIIYCYLSYQRGGSFGFAAAAVALAGFDYLDRPNGLFIFVSLMAVLILGDIHRFWTTSASNGGPGLLKRCLLYAALVALFTIITIPSWLPRLQAFGNPIYHGYLSNYLWVDTYHEAHVGQRGIRYTWHDYASNHTLWDAVKRMASGIWRVLFEIPWRVEKRFPLLIILATIGAAISLVRGPLEFRLLFVFAVVQLLPLMWTTISNPTIRVPYASTFPFELAFAAYALAYGKTLLTPLFVKMIGQQGRPIPFGY